MALYTCKLTSGSTIRIPYVSHTSFKRGRDYVYDSKNPQHQLAIETLSSDSAFSYTVKYTPEEEAEEILKLEADQKHLAETRRRHEAELAIKAAEYAEQAAMKAAADAQEAKEKALAARKILDEEDKKEAKAKK